MAAENVAAGVGQFPKNDRRQSAVGGVEERSRSRGLCTDLFVFCMQGKSMLSLAVWIETYVGMDVGEGGLNRAVDII